jgi:hypothetical protein
MEKVITPLIIKKPMLESRNIAVKGANDFGMFSQQPISNPQKQNNENKPIFIEELLQKKPKNTVSDLYKSSQTAKISPDVKIRLNLIESFMIELGGLSSDTTLSQIIDVLLNHYVDEKLSPRQREGFKGIYQQKIENYK